MCDVETKRLIKRCKFNKVRFFNWVNSSTLGMVTDNSVFHWYVHGEARPQFVFHRLEDKEKSQHNIVKEKICNYINDASAQVLVLVLAGSYIGKVTSTSGTDTYEESFFMQVFTCTDELPMSYLLPGCSAPTFCQFKLSTGVERRHLCLIAPDDCSLCILGEHSWKLYSPENEEIKFGTEEEMLNDRVCDLQASDKYGLVFILTAKGNVHVFDVEYGVCIYRTSVIEHLHIEELVFHLDTEKYQETEGIIARSCRCIHKERTR